MAETSTAANNKSITYRGKTEREMSTNHKDGDGKPNEDASFMAKGKGAKKPGKSMRKKAKRAMGRGMISEKAAKKHLSEY